MEQSVDTLKGKADEQSDVEDEKRKRILTEKGQILYESTRQELSIKLETLWKDVQLQIDNSNACYGDLILLRICEKELTKSFAEFQELANELAAYLSRTGTEESKQDLDSHNLKVYSLRLSVDSAAKHVDSCIQEALEKFSHRTSKTKSESKSKGSDSHSSTGSSLLAKTLAKAEAAKAAVEFAVKEADILRQQALIDEQQQVTAAQAIRKKAELQAECKLLQQRKEAAQAEAEVNALRATSVSSDVQKSSIQLPAENSQERTRVYVSQLRQMSQDQNNRTQRDRAGAESLLDRQASTRPRNRPLDPNAPVFQSAAPFVSTQECQAEDFSHFLLKKDLLLSRLRYYNDQPESYSIWKYAFQSVMGELRVTHMEELDLLVKWLGPESTKHALSLRASNAQDPQKGLERLWQRLDERYGSPEMVEASLKSRLTNFPKLTNRDNKRLYELADLLCEIESVKSCEKYSSMLAYFDSSTGVNPIVHKLPYSLQERWTTQAFRYKERHSVSFPPFAIFVEFVQESSKVRNDPSFVYESGQSVSLQKEKPYLTQKTIKPAISSRKTEVQQSQKENSTEEVALCPLHKTKHSLNECKAFREKTIEERKEFIKRHRLCYRCCMATTHIARMCKQPGKCSVCNDPRHATALHIDYPPPVQSDRLMDDNSGEKDQTIVKGGIRDPVSSKCTQICGEAFSGKSCAKTVLVNVYPKGQPELSVKMYSLLDDQSNSSLARSKFFEIFNIDSDKVRYTLSSCAGVVETSGRRGSGFVVESVDSGVSFDLQTVIECNSVPNQRDEIPTPDVALHYPHLVDIADNIPPVDESADILLLIGRDLIQAHHVYDHRIGQGKTPYAQKLPLGWVIIGESCIGKVHEPDIVNVKKTYLLKNGRTSLFKPCPNSFDLKINISQDILSPEEMLGRTVFEVTKNDDKPGLSVEDHEFLQIMDQEMYRGTSGNWVAPLPFKSPRPLLPNNKPQAIKRANTLDGSITKDAVKKKHMLDFMEKIFENKHAEIAPPLKSGEECWYLPLFGVYHPKKPNQVRVVFDSSAQYNGVSLNNVLLQGPDMTNSLLDILIRFRKHDVAVMGDIQQMFYCFQVREEHRNYLRFLWYKDNDPNRELIEYRMTVHVFGNSPSPAIATYGLRKTVETGKNTFGEDVEQFVKKDFYVDDGLTSTPNADQAVDLVKRTQQTLQEFGNLRLHKITSNSSQVVEAFQSEDLAKDFKDLNFEENTFPLQRSLGMSWDVKSDTFTFRVSDEAKPYTKRGVLSTINSLYDPMGFVAPVIIKGKILLRELISQKLEWDDMLPEELRQEWENWRDSLRLLEQLQIPRKFLPMSLQKYEKKEVCVYCDASEKAIAAVAYLMAGEKTGKRQMGFLLGKTKVAPTHGHTIPRLELSAAVLGVEIGNFVCECLNIPLTSVNYFTDSRIVLGYISNKTRRFSVYVSNRVAKIRKLSSSQQWNYVATDLNPSDCATRSISANLVGNSSWLQGPSQLPEKDQHTEFSEDEENSTELLTEVTSCVTSVVHKHEKLDSHRYEKFSNWKKLVEAIARLRQLVRNHNCKTKRESKHVCTGIVGSHAYMASEHFIIQQVQHEVYATEIDCIRSKSPLPKDSSIRTLNPVIDEEGMLRVGGRLGQADLSTGHKHPLIIPGHHHIATLLVRHYHEQVKHQGRHFSEGAVRAAGLWVTSGKRLINSLIYKCVKCRKLRGREAQQKMANLPVDRLTQSPPFTYVGVDTFGPWNVVTRRTRGGQANSKRWALLFTCLVVRAIHIEVIEELSTSAFINALRRFTSIRGRVKEFRSDRGTNFIGAAGILNVHVINVEDEQIQSFLSENKTSWIFNPPHSSHMGGVWERMIGISRRILDSMLTDVSSKNFTHEVLTTLMAEVCAIVNARPIVPISSDPESPGILTPSTLLTLKTEHVEEMVSDFQIKDLYKSQWRQVQSLADQFWGKWKNEYLHTLQRRHKWFSDEPNVSQDDVVLLKEKNTARNEWPIGVIEKAIPSTDGKVRKAVVRVIREKSATTYTRPISEMVVLLSAEKSNK
ncbi:uncharacterized protein [Haliotis cracherodii]|uniref:uncharacterized protein n=1 Tax=Haliotis cracherodii TaxID=6455 RepID=UPI0039E9E0B6